MIEVINLQRKVPIETREYQQFGEMILREVSEAKDRRFAVAFIGDSRMKELNGLFRGKSNTTDVLSFPHEPDEFDPDKDSLGDIVISAEQAGKQAAENGLSLEAEIKQLILHGVLHLCGYDHETDNGEMNEREIELRDRIGIA